MENIRERIDALSEAINQLSQLEQTPEIASEVTRLKAVVYKLEKKAGTLYDPWDKVKIARKIERPRAQFYIDSIVTDFIELHGDRAFRDDKAIIGGIGQIGGHTVTIIAQNKGNTAKENIDRNFGMPHPEGYRKALRLMKQAEKFNRPVVCLIDTPGAYCGIGAEERGQGEAIARNLMEMARLRVPVISGIIGEGGSGGALALGVADKVFMQENTTYSILSPEGFASILWKDSNRAKEAAGIMKITARDLLEYGIIDDIVEEPVGGAHKDAAQAACTLKEYIVSMLDELSKKDCDKLVEERYERFRKYGEFYEA
ncbi:MAG: acetyl-CoA carboxylase carboxyltransferase subunit alpha [Clostridia bacterium]|jgi:acetyl-CoA carboxylase carboxyl transferase alpha subunit|nr:acetyl-CoA carboxylase carboxyltransferase subunit alpha [Clostridia bacterium]